MKIFVEDKTVSRPEKPQAALKVIVLDRGLAVDLVDPVSGDHLAHVLEITEEGLETFDYLKGAVGEQVSIPFRLDGDDVAAGIRVERN